MAVSLRDGWGRKGGQTTAGIAYKPSVNLVRTSSSLALLALVAGFAALPGEALATACEPCSGSVACSGLDEVCLGGLPENDGVNGRCTAPCPNPGAAFGGCPTDYTCIPLNDGSRVCAPRSDDCTALGNYTPAAPGQSCSTQSCTNNALCLDGTCRSTCSSFGSTAGCGSGEQCGFIGLPTSPVFVCGTPVGEGALCNTGDICTVGLCLDDGTGARCFRNCGSGAGSSSCQPSQTCDSVELQGGAVIEICQPPMTGPAPDAGVRDVGFPDANASFPDAMTNPAPDANGSFPDAMTNPGLDASTNPGDDARVTNPGDDAQVGEGDGGTVRADTGRASGGGSGGGVVRRSSGCSAMGGADGVVSLAVLVLPALVLVRRRRRARA